MSVFSNRRKDEMKKFIEKRTEGGFTLLELMIVSVVAVILLVMAYAVFPNNPVDCENDRPGFVARAYHAAAMADLMEINLKLEAFDLNNRRLPTGLAEMGIDTLDPWGNPYVFLNFADVNGNGPKRKFRNAVPVNSYFDVYSMGPDGKTATPFTSMLGADDLVIANNGQYIGMACHYYGS